jgi:acyl-CoA synthetase (AMP-forming)/AMP-acid ligase II
LPYASRAPTIRCPSRWGELSNVARRIYFACRTPSASSSSRNGVRVAVPSHCGVLSVTMKGRLWLADPPSEITTIVGRIKDMVIRGGENIYPREIEEFLYTHPDVEDVQVIGVPDEKYGEELCAWIRMRPGAEPLDADKLRDFATGKLAHYKIPRYVLLVDEFPMTVTGKVRKVQMREETTARLGLSTRPSA